MPLPNVFATQPAGTVPASFLDANFNALGNGLIVPCTAVGATTIALTPLTNYPTITSYFNYGMFSFVAAGTSAGPVTINISGVGASNLYLSNGTQAGSGAIVSGVLYIVGFNQALNTGSGGFALVSTGQGGGANPVMHSQVFTSTGTFTVPSGTTSATVFKFTAVGGGAGGNNAAGGNSAGGGGSGGAGKAEFSGFTALATVTINIGAGGIAAGAGSNTTVVSGGVSIITAGGGQTGGSLFAGGAAGTFTATAGASGLTLVASWPAGAQPGGIAASPTNNVSAFGGGNSIGTGGLASSGGAGNPGTNGGGGSGGAGSSSGGAGGNGIVIVEWVL